MLQTPTVRNRDTQTTEKQRWRERERGERERGEKERARKTEIARQGGGARDLIDEDTG